MPRVREPVTEELEIRLRIKRRRRGSAALAFACAFALPATGAGAQELSVSTQPALYPAFAEDVSDYVTRCATGTPVDVTVSAPAGTEVDVDGQGPRGGSFATNVSLRPGQGFAIAAAGTTAASYHVRCLPSDFPASTFQRPGQPQAEFYAISPLARTDFQPVPPGVSANYVALFDGHGVPVWWFKTAEQATDFHALPNGNVATTRGNGNHERRLDGSLVRTINAVGADIDPHEILLQPNGNYLINTLRVIEGFNPCGGAPAPILDNGSQEIAPDGSLVWEWWASDHILDSEVPPVWCDAVDFNGVLDPYHINSIEPDGDGFIMSFRHLDAVYKVDKADGHVVWKLGGTVRPESLTVLDDPLAAGGDTFRGQHDPRVLSDGTVTVHDNGWHPDAVRAPRAVRYAIDTNAMTATLVEQQNDPGGVTTALCCGSARKLPTGNWLMAWGSAGVITEVSPSGGLVFRLTFDDSLFSYRAHPVLFGELSGTALRAGMDAQFPRGYPRPKGAPLFRVPLVPAYQPCVTPDRTHGEPLAFGSCSSPDESSGFLTVGTPDANGAQANSIGHLRYQVLLGDPTTPASESDVSVRVQLTDVRLQSDLSDYTGQLQLRGAVRITDRLNGPLQNEAATGLNTDFPVVVPCTATASTSVGATCSVTSTLNAIVPGAAVEKKRATWSLGQAQVFDGGPSGVAGDSGATLFQTQGAFVP